MKNFLILSLLLAFLTTEVCAQWKPAGDKIKTQWANKINTSAVLPEYPRPIMERNEWKNLNGLWEYAITDLGGNVPAHFDGQILVPFAVESSLSGVGQRVGAKKELWYSRSFEVPVAWKNKNVLLHFGAVDWKADIWVYRFRKKWRKSWSIVFRLTCSMLSCIPSIIFLHPQKSGNSIIMPVSSWLPIHNH